jgi:hypothetical protein
VSAAYGVVQRRRCRESGGIVEVIDAAAPGSDMDADEARWWTLCEAHGSICSHETRALAVSWSSAPMTWCEICQEMPAHLAADGDSSQVDPASSR